MRCTSLALTLTLACAPTPAGAGAVPEVEVRPDGSRSIRLPGSALVELERAPHSVLPTSSSATDLALDLLPAERIAGLVELALDYSKLAGAPLPEALAHKPLLGAFETELVLHLHPDLVLTHAWQDPTGLEALARRGIPNLALPVVSEWKDLVAQIEAVAELLDAGQRGGALVAELEARRAQLERTRPAPRRLLGISSYGDALWTAGSGTTVDLMLRLAGQRNAAAEAGLTGNQQLRLEELLALDPDAFVTGGGAGGTGLDFLRAHPLLSQLAAVREERFLTLPAHLYSTSSHEVLRAAEVLVELLRAD